MSQRFLPFFPLFVCLFVCLGVLSLLFFSFSSEVRFSIFEVFFFGSILSSFLVQHIFSLVLS